MRLHNGGDSKKITLIGLTLALILIGFSGIPSADNAQSLQQQQKIVVAGTSWKSASICGETYPGTLNLAQIAMANLDPITDMVSSASPGLVTFVSNNSGLQTIAVDGNNLITLDAYLDRLVMNDVPADFVSFDVSPDRKYSPSYYSNGVVRDAADMITDAGYDVAFSGIWGKEKVRTIAKEGDLFVYEAQALLFQNQDRWLADLEQKASWAKQRNADIIVVPFIPVRSESSSCQFTLQDAISVAEQVSLMPNVDGILVFNWKDPSELNAMVDGVR